MEQAVNKIIRFWRNHHIFQCCDCCYSCSISQMFNDDDSNEKRCIDCWWEYDHALKHGCLDEYKENCRRLNFETCENYTNTIGNHG